jgi:hypothetical protein
MGKNRGVRSFRPDGMCISSLVQPFHPDGTGISSLVQPFHQNGRRIPSLVRPFHPDGRCIPSLVQPFRRTGRRIPSLVRPLRMATTHVPSTVWPPRPAPRPIPNTVRPLLGARAFQPAAMWNGEKRPCGRRQSAHRAGLRTGKSALRCGCRMAPPHLGQANLSLRSPPKREQIGPRCTAPGQTQSVLGQTHVWPNRC